VNSGGSGSLVNSGVWGRGSRGNIRGLGQGGDCTSNQTMSCWGRSKALGMASSITSYTKRAGRIGGGTISQGQEKGKSDERSHDAS